MTQIEQKAGLSRHIRGTPFRLVRGAQWPWEANVCLGDEIVASTDMQSLRAIRAALSARPDDSAVERVAEAIWKRRQEIAWEGGEQPVPWHYAPASKVFMVREDARAAIAALGGSGDL